MRIEGRRTIDGTWRLLLECDQSVAWEAWGNLRAALAGGRMRRWNALRVLDDEGQEVESWA